MKPKWAYVLACQCGVVVGAMIALVAQGDLPLFVGAIIATIALVTQVAAAVSAGTDETHNG